VPWVSFGVWPASTATRAVEEPNAAAANTEASQAAGEGQDLALEPGLFIAATKIRLRTSPDTSSAPTGEALKEGEVFEATEVVKPDGPGSLGYLRVGDRGWVFDRGISGAWVGKPIVENVPEEDRDVYRQILSDPSNYAEYRAIMDDPDHLSKIESMLNEKNLKESLEKAVKDPEQMREIEQLWKDIEDESARRVAQAKAASAQAPVPVVETTPVAEGQLETPAEQKSMLDTLAEKDPSFQELFDKDPQFKEILEKARENAKNINPKRPNEPRTMVAPRWMKLAGVQWEDVERDEDGKLRQPIINEPPGGERALRRRPSCNGWRMGIRVPSVCSTL